MGFGSGGHTARGAATCERSHSIDLAWLPPARHQSDNPNGVLVDLRHIHLFCYRTPVIVGMVPGVAG